MATECNAGWKEKALDTWVNNIYPTMDNTIRTNGADAVQTYQGTTSATQVGLAIPSTTSGTSLNPDELKKIMEYSLKDDMDEIVVPKKPKPAPDEWETAIEKASQAMKNE